jgi:hypothetical protein
MFRPVRLLQGTAGDQPGALEVQVGLGAEKVEVAVVVQNTEAVPICDRSEDEVDRGKR